MSASKVFRPAMALVEQGETRSLLAAADQFRLWLEQARPGERMAYARATWLPPRQEACVSTLVREAFDAGEVRLLQCRLPPPPEGPGGYEYLVERRSQRLRPAVRFTARSAREQGDALFGGKK